MSGRCDSRPELAAAAMPLEVHVRRYRAGAARTCRRVFEPLGWAVGASTSALDPGSRRGGLALRRSAPLAPGGYPNHLYVLLPVLDDAKRTG
jgi:hypothetical protein